MADHDPESSRRLAQVLAEQMRDRRVVVDEVPPTRSTRLLVWAFSLMIAALVGVAEVTFLIGAKDETALMPSGGVAALPASDPCVARLDRITTALAAYKQKHGRYPADLAALSAELKGPAVCPFSGQPYAYIFSATSPSLACHHGHARTAEAEP